MNDIRAIPIAVSLLAYALSRQHGEVGPQLLHQLIQPLFVAGLGSIDEPQAMREVGIIRRWFTHDK